MLTIKKFADLSGTTRRTLIFYDQKDLFKRQITSLIRTSPE